MHRSVNPPLTVPKPQTILPVKIPAQTVKPEKQMAPVQHQILVQMDNREMQMELVQTQIPAQTVNPEEQMEPVRRQILVQTDNQEMQMERVRTQIPVQMGNREDPMERVHRPILVLMDSQEEQMEHVLVAQHQIVPRILTFQAVEEEREVAIVGMDK